MNHINNTKREDIERLIKQAQFENKYKQNKNVNDLNKTIIPDKKEINFINKNLLKSAIKRDQLVKQKRQALEESFGNNSIKSILDHLNPHKNWYLNFGGAGDLILLLANAYDDKNAQVVFLANPNSMNFCEELLQFFKLDYFISKNLMGTKYANMINDYMTQKINFKPSAHLSRGLDFGDWAKDIEYYKKRMVLKTDWVERYGKNLLFEGKKIIILQPSGSIRNNDRQRYLEFYEYNFIVRKFIDLGYDVITTGSDSDKDFYKWKPIGNRDWFMTSKQICGHKNMMKIDLNIFIQTLNSAVKIISADTWLKSYSLLCSKPTIVFLNRCRGNYLSIGADQCDHIFLNKNLWTTLELKTVPEIMDMN